MVSGRSRTPAVRARVEALEGTVDDLRETQAADIDGLDARLEELEAIREVVAAERAWCHRAERSGGRLAPDLATTG